MLAQLCSVWKQLTSHSTKRSENSNMDDISQKQVKTFWSDGGQVNPDPAKVKATQEVPIPKNVRNVHRFLGMVNQLGKFFT